MRTWLPIGSSVKTTYQSLFGLQPSIYRAFWRSARCDDACPQLTNIVPLAGRSRHGTVPVDRIDDELDREGLDLHPATRDRGAQDPDVAVATAMDGDPAFAM